MIESLLLTAAPTRTFEQQRLLANASSFFARARPMRTRVAALLSLLALAIGLVSPSLAQSLTGQRFVLPRTRDWTGDFSAMLKRRTLRILVPYSKTLFFVDRGRQMGVVAEFGRALEDRINARYKFQTPRFHVTFLPSARDRLLQALNEGKGDAVAANLTITSERLAVIDFVDPWLKNVKEIVVTGPTSPKLDSIADLSGREIRVRHSSSYASHLAKLSDTFVAKGLRPIAIMPIDENLEDEDLIEMVNAGLLPYAVVDDHKATIWSRIFPNAVPRGDLVVSEGGDIAWAIRKNSPELMSELNAFINEHRAATNFGATIRRHYFVDKRIVKNALDENEARKFVVVIDLFRRYGAQYNFDYLMIAAQAYQESQLDQSRRGAAGGVGLMQIKPSTAAGKPIGITGIDRDPDRNVHAGCAYLRYLADTYVSDPAIDPVNRTLMSFAAYNAGPRNLQEFRAVAQQAGLDPNIWFNNVELGAAKVAGLAPVQYVSNIYKYYISYQLAVERLEASTKAREDMNAEE
jgi:membrane-bound lytic murein transglycosylase MltF